MTTVLTDSENYTNIANSIRTQLGVQTTYRPSDMPAAIASISGGGGGTSPFITASYQGLSYSYVSLDNGFYQENGQIYMMNLYEISAGTYVFFVGQTTSNRLRAHFYNNKSLSDFETYLENGNGGGTATKIYTCDTNVTGQAEKAGDGLLQRVFFETATSGSLLIVTSNMSVNAPTMLIKLS